MGDRSRRDGPAIDDMERARDGFRDEVEMMLLGEPVINEERVGPRVYEGVGQYGLRVGGNSDWNDKVCFWVEDSRELKRCERNWSRGKGWAPWWAQGVASSET